MSNNNNTENNRESRINIDPNLSRGDVLKRYHENKIKHYLYGIVSFAMTAMFYVTFTSPAWVTRILGDSFGDAVTAGLWALVGLLFSITITVLIMHSHTTDNKHWKHGAYALIIGLGILFNVFTEVSSTSDRVQERVQVKSEDSALFKALTHSVKNSTATASSATGFENQIAKAEQKLARCIENLKRGKEKHCRGDAAKVKSLKESANSARQAGIENTKTLIQEAKEAGNNTDYAQMTIRFVMEKFSVSYITATMLVSLFIIGTFEILGVMIGSDYRRYRDALPHYGIDLHRGKEIKYELDQLERETIADEKKMKAEIKQLETDLKRHKAEVEQGAKADKLRSELERFKQQLAGQTSPSAGSARVSPDDNNAPSSSDAEVEKLRAEMDLLRQKLEAKNDDELSTMERQKSMIDDEGMVSIKTPLKSNDKHGNDDNKVSMYKHACNNMDKNHSVGTKRNSHPKSKKIRLDKSVKAKKGDEVSCPECGTPFIKKTYNHTFCKPVCRDNYHNDADNTGKRIEIKEAVQRKRKRKA